MTRDAEVRYEVTVTITRAVEYDRDDPIEEQAAWAVSPEAKRELEREVLRSLRKLDGDCDCEVMTAEVVDGVAEEPRDEAYERAAARYDGEGPDWR